MTWICNGCSVSGVMPDGVWLVLVMAIVSTTIGLPILYATLGGTRRRLRWQA